jgi:Spx/MgsR family transcriptional regulator
MVKVYGIKNCDSVKKSLKFLKEKGIEFEFIDFKTTHINEEKIKKWLQKIDIDKLFNKRSTTYRKLDLKDKKLNLDEKIELLAQNNLLIKRAVVEVVDKVLIGFDKKEYENIFQ